MTLNHGPVALVSRLPEFPASIFYIPESLIPQVDWK